MMKRLNIGLVITVLCLLVLHYSVRDYYYWSSLIFYAFPLPIILGLSLALLILNVKKKKIKPYIFFSILIFGLWFSSSFMINSLNKEEISGEKEHVKIWYWNAAKRNNFLDVLEGQENFPDLIVLVEYDQTEKEKLSVIKEKYPKYYFSVIRGKIGVFSKSPIRNIKPMKMKNNSFMVGFNTKLKGKNYNVYGVDITANIKHFRRPMLEEALTKIQIRGKTMILGDFNTPYESIHFRSYKEKFKHAFTNKGNGFRETWFWNMPILSLDHIWVSKEVHVSQIDKSTTWKSDHSLLKMMIKN